MKHRELNNQEIKCIKNTLSNYLNKEDMEKFNFENLYLLHDNDKHNVIYSTDEVLRYLKLFKNIYGAGILFGDLKKDKNKIKFSLSLEGMDLISKNIIKNYAIINKKGETLFLYGRDIFKSSILKLNGTGRISIFNKDKEFLGIGNYNNKGEVIKNIIDKGWYLRKGG